MSIIIVQIYVRSKGITNDRGMRYPPLPNQYPGFFRKRTGSSNHGAMNIIKTEILLDFRSGQDPD